MKLLLVDVKVNSNILMRLGMVVMTQNRQKYIIFTVDPQLRVENRVGCIS